MVRKFGETQAIHEYVQVNLEYGGTEYQSSLTAMCSKSLFLIHRIT